MCTFVLKGAYYGLSGGLFPAKNLLPATRTRYISLIWIRFDTLRTIYCSYKDKKKDNPYPNGKIVKNLEKINVESFYLQDPNVRLNIFCIRGPPPYKKK